MAIPICRTVPDLRDAVATWRRAGASIAVVPTMGALHDGHLALVQAATARANRVIVTLFVNPKQFNNPGDLASYPRDEQVDADKLATSGADLLYAPSAALMYPAGFSTTVSVTGVTDGLCGGSRPGHFDGVATVVTKLLLQTGADFALFGEKDFQQLLVIRRLVRDLDLPVEIIGFPIVRDSDGLALSSRNLRLSPSERRMAPLLARQLAEAADRIKAGEAVAGVIEACRSSLLGQGFARVDYLELRSEDDLAPLSHIDRPGRLLAAVWLGDTRLIDNVPVASVSREAGALPPEA